MKSYDFGNLDLTFKVTWFSRSSSLKKTVNSAFSELCILNQWVFHHQTCIDTLFGDRKELDFDDIDPIFKVKPQHFVISV